jgi:GT2 family glycosyltransferase
MKNFSVVVCTYNRHNLVERCLKNILANTLLPNKIIVVDQNLNFLTRDKIINFFKNNNFKNYIIIRNLDKRGLTKSKNISLKYICTKYVFFIDDDIMIKNNYFYENIKLLFKKKGHGSSGVMSNYKSGSINDFFYYIFNYNLFKDNRYYFKNYKKLRKKKTFSKVYQLPGGMTCFDSKIFKKIIFDEKFIIHNYEDVEFNIRLRSQYENLKLFINLNTSVEDSLNKNFKENIFMRFYYLRLIYLKNRNLKLFFYYYLSLTGLIVSNLLKLSKKDYLKIYEFLKKADKKIN